jgi:hypothetical protein
MKVLLLKRAPTLATCPDAWVSRDRVVPTVLRSCSTRRCAGIAYSQDDVWAYELDSVSSTLPPG